MDGGVNPGLSDPYGHFPSKPSSSSNTRFGLNGAFALRDPTVDNVFFHENNVHDQQSLNRHEDMKNYDDDDDEDGDEDHEDDT